MLKGSYEQAFYVGNQIQLATDAPQLLATIDKIDELTLKVDTNLDVKVSTRLADADYLDPATAQQIWEYTTRTLTSAGAAGATLAEIEASTILAMKADVQAVETKVDTKPTLAEMESVDSNLAKQDLLQDTYSTVNNIDIRVEQLAGNDFDAMTDSLDAISTKVDLKPSLSDIENSTILAKENTSQAIKDKVDTLENTNLIGIATATDVTTAKDEVLTAINDIPATDLTGVTEDLTIINNGVKKASLLIPHTDSL
jgi:galactitol-specific phosphotransferase system IIB component